MKPAATFPDPERKVVGYLASIGVADEVEVGHPSRTLTGAAKYVQVEAEYGDPTAYPVTERAQVRVTCHMPAGQRTAVKSLASLVQAYLLAWPGDADVAGVFPQLGRSNVVTDPATSNLMVWFTVSVALKPSVVSVP